MAETPHWLEIAYWVSQIILTCIAAGTAYFAYGQWGAATEAREQQTGIAHANMIMELDRRFESAEMVAARAQLAKLLDEIKVEVGGKFPRSSDVQKEAQIRAAWALRLAGMKVDDQDAHAVLIRICGFFESVGVMVERKYMDLGDAIALFKGPILDVDICFRSHIEEWQKETGVPPGLFEFALKLCDLTKSL